MITRPHCSTVAKMADEEIVAMAHSDTKIRSEKRNNYVATDAVYTTAVTATTQCKDGRLLFHLPVRSIIIGITGDRKVCTNAVRFC